MTQKGAPSPRRGVPIQESVQKQRMRAQGYITISEAEARIGISKNAFHKLVKSGKLRYMQIGAIYYLEVTSLLDYFGRNADARRQVEAWLGLTMVPQAPQRATVAPMPGQVVPPAPPSVNIPAPKVVYDPTYQGDPSIEEDAEPETGPPEEDIYQADNEPMDVDADSTDFYRAARGIVDNHDRQVRKASRRPPQENAVRSVRPIPPTVRKRR